MQTQNIVITGQLVNKANKPLSNLRIEAWDKDLLFDDFVGEAMTDTDGRFEISFTEAHYRELFFDTRPDLYFKIYTNDSMIHSTENTVLCNIDDPQRDIVITVEADEDTEPQEQDIKATFFKLHLKSQKLQDDFYKIYKAFDGYWPDIKQELLKNNSFSPELIKKLEFTNQLADWGNNNERLVALFDSEHQTNSMREIALQLNRDEFISKVQNTAPAEYKNKIEYAEKLHEQLFFLEPTAILINIGRDRRIPILNDSIGKNVISVLEKQPDFNIKTTSIYEILKKEELLSHVPEELKAEVQSQLKIVQRIATVSSSSVAIPALYTTNFHSAAQIASLPGEQFATMMFNEGLERNVALQIVANAQQAVARNEQTLISLKEVQEGTGIEFIDRSLNIYEDEGILFYDPENEPVIIDDFINNKDVTVYNFLKKNNLSWDLLFGDADFCECSECTSVYSPASYYVELLQYLRNNNLDPENSKTKKKENDITNTPLEKLFKRRPDLGCLELTCKNTNTVLPYVDLVNEVMESYLVSDVDHKITKPFNVEDETSGELLSEPQHTDREAYRILSKAVYPLSLPYHQPIDAARIYLNHLGTSRHELMHTFDKNAEYTIQNRANDAEFLGMTEQEYIILTKEPFNINKKNSPGEIDLKPVHYYYGYKSDGALQGNKGLRNIKDQFLKRTGIDYVNLIDLLQTEFINPNLPKGISKIILESVANKYSYLLEYALENGFDKMGEVIIHQISNSDLSNWEDGDAPICETNAVKRAEISDYDIINWAEKEFLKLGKLIVIESGSSDSCNLDDAILQHLDGSAVSLEEYDRIHRFIRLWRKLGWTIDETDKAIVGLSLHKSNSIKNPKPIILPVNNDSEKAKSEINVKLINQLVSVKKILKTTGLELVKLLAFWTDISTTGENSLYRRLFLTHNLVKLDPVFKADASGNFLTANEKIVDHKPVLMAALNLSSQDIDLLINPNTDEKLTIHTISKLYRYRLLSKALGLKISELIDFLFLFEDVFSNAATTLKFLETCSRMEDAGFSPFQLNYIIGNLDSEKIPLAPSKKEVLLLTKVLYDGLNAIEDAHKDLSGESAEEEATIELVMLKASLLLEPAVVEKIAGVLEGTTTYSTTASIPDDLVPKYLEITNKLVYSPSLGKIQIKGILTDEEIIKLKKINNNPDWDKAIEEIQKQQNKGYKEIFEDNFSIDPAIEKVIKAGDISFPLDVSTAPKKRVAFLSIFLPYLRKELSHRFIIEILAEQTGLEATLVDVLVTKILKQPSQEPIYKVLAKIKEQSNTQENNWKGYLIPNTTGIYRLIVKNTDQSPNITLDGSTKKFNKKEDSEKEWWNDNVVEVDIELEAGKLYTLSSDTTIKNIYWKTAASSIAPIPTAALIPDFAWTDCASALDKLKKVAIIVSTFKLSSDEIRFLNQNKEFEGLDFNTLSLNHFLRLEAYTRLRNSLPQTKLNLLDFFHWVDKIASDTKELSDKIVELTGWKKEIIDKLIEENHFKLVKDDFKDERNLLKLQQAIEVANKIGMDLDHLFTWADPFFDESESEKDKFNGLHEIATSLKNAIRAKYKQTDWEQVIKPAHDLLRNNQKEALIAYLLEQEEFKGWNIVDADSLFEYFLIDVQMDAVMETSRIKQAIASVQLFIQRCFLGLEEEHNNISPEKLDRSRWEWMQRYRVWEANRKVFLYPENWIETNLRDDKSPFFKELESELLQKDINKQNVADALKSYLYKVDEVANMEVIGLYIEGEKENYGWVKGAKLHVFSRTRNAPYFFFYRFMALDEMNWYPWEKMDVDITSYDVENSKTHQIIDNGCYISAIVWNDRLIVFFPQIVKKIVANENSQKLTIAESADLKPEGLKPDEYHEIKMAWSEYRNGKWTQKQISNNNIYNSGSSYTSTMDINLYSIRPEYSEKISNEIGIKIFYDNQTLTNLFTFDGNRIDVISIDKVKFNYWGEDIGKLNFHYIENTMFPLQDKYYSSISSPRVIHSTSEKTLVNIHLALFTIQPFYDNNIRNLLGKTSFPDFEEFFKNNTKDFKFGQYTNSKKTSSGKIYHELKEPYSLYNWELFFHTPMALADSLSKAQQFEEAMKWYHYVFNPVSQDGFDDKRFWQFSPFKEANSKNILEAIFNQLQPNTPDQSINEWRNKPFMPHVVARSRPVAYMKWVVMKYIDNLVAWGDYLFRQDTIETINQATQLYVLAGHILGPRPRMIPKRGKTKPQTYMGLLNKWDAFGNAMDELEIAVPYSNQTPLSRDKKSGELANVNIFGQASTLYFCIPKNPKLIAYWDTIGDRLFKIRHSQNIEGIFRKMPLFEPPIDPALLVKAAAQGLSIASVLNDLNTSMPNYRFYYLLQKALELCNELKSLGGALLSAFEKKDNETIALIRSKHENVMNSLMMEIKKKQLEEAQKNLESLEQNRKAPEERMKYYLQLTGMDESLLPDANTDFSAIANTISTVDGESGLKLNAFEKEDMDKASDAREKQSQIAHIEMLASILHVIPTLTTQGSPLGVGFAGMLFSGTSMANAAQAVGKGFQIGANTLSYQSTSAAKKGGFSRAMQDRVQQANAAGYELKQIDKQITAQKIRIEIANQEISNQQQLMENALEVEEFLKNKYTNEELYTWMRGSLKTLYHQVYGLTYELAKKAERVYRFERGISSSSFIQSGYWDAGRNGLLAGEQLYVGLKQMEAAYQNERGYDYEITKHISLQQIDPMALIYLRETGKCEFSFPEVLFDMDYAGHYKRRIKSVSISIPCVVGPYTGVNATLRLLENKFRNTATAIQGKSYEEETNEEEDNRFSRFIIPITAIATSSAQNDSGMFELNFKDERYLPFEGAGVISKWRLELPLIPQFNYQTIADAIIHVKYIASEGGEGLKSLANHSVDTKLKAIQKEFSKNGLAVLINIKHDLPNEWHMLKENLEISLTIDKTRLPYMVQSFEKVSIENILFVAKVKEKPEGFTFDIDNIPLLLKKDANSILYAKEFNGITLGKEFKLKTAESADKLEELLMIINYKILNT